MSRATAFDSDGQDRGGRPPGAIGAALESTNAVLGRPTFLAAMGDAAAPIAVIARWRHRATAVDVVPEGPIRLAMSLTDGERVHRRASGSHLADRVRAGSVTVFSQIESSRVLVTGEADVLQILLSPDFFEGAVEARYAPPPLSDLHDPEIQAAFVQLLVAGTRDRPDDHVRSAEALYALVDRLHTLAAPFKAGAISSTRAKGGLSPAAFRRVQESVEAALSGSQASSASLDDMAAAADLSVSHFRRAFRQHVGATPHAFLTRRRMERALTMLRSTEGTIASIADQVGFSSPAHFGAAFRCIMGVTPGMVREALAKRCP